MTLRRGFVAAVLVAGVRAAPPSASSKISWQSCDPTEFNSSLTINCGTLSVPLDYTTSNSTEELTLKLIRAPAITQPSRGSILFNFGGPGEPDRHNFVSTLPTLLPITGGEYDLISFETRGTGETLPMSCYKNELETMAMYFDVHPTSNSSDNAAARAWARAGVDAHLCYQRAQVNGSLVSTAFTARDMISIVDALGEDGKLRYSGYSYGTTLGFTAAAMFPDRIDKMVLDGVQNPHEYYNGHADIQEWTDGDAVFSRIFSTCIAAGDACPFSAMNATAAELEQATWDLLESLKSNPIPLGSQLMDYTFAKRYIHQAIYSTSYWPDLTAFLATLFSGNATAIDGLGEIFSTTDSTSNAIAANIALVTGLTAIHCSDTKPRLATFDEFRPILDEMYNTSSVMGDNDDIKTMRCAQWKIQPKERYEGGFTVQTKNPVLFIGNTWDGYTPLASAYNMSSGFNGSTVLEVRGEGHTSLAVPSKCALQKTLTYWTNGTLPEPGTICESDGKPYSNITWDTIIEESGWNYTTGFGPKK